jgi:hypothetical protein
MSHMWGTSRVIVGYFMQVEEFFKMDIESYKKASFKFF